MGWVKTCEAHLCIKYNLQADLRATDGVVVSFSAFHRKQQRERRAGFTKHLLQLVLQQQKT